MTDQTDLCPTCGGSGKHPLVYLACHGEGRINVASSETRSTSMSHEPKNAPKDVSELCPDCGHKLRERTHPLIHCAAPPGRCFCRGWILRKPPKELSERGLHTTETVADGSITEPVGVAVCIGCPHAYHGHLRKCKDCYCQLIYERDESESDMNVTNNPKVSNSEGLDSPPQPDPNCLTCKDNWPYCSEHNYWLLEPTEEMKAVTAEIAQEVDDILDSPPPLQESERIRRAAMNIVNQLGDLWAIPVADRQQGNDKADDFTAAIIAAETHRARAEGARAEHDKIYALYNQMFEPNGEFRSFASLKPKDIMAFFERLKELESALDKQEPRS